jgi:alpha-D-xyloside xylohydrolase
VKLKILLTPYILAEALRGHRDGTPLMRALFLEFPKDLNTYAIDTQYMFGSNLLVAPVFNEAGEVTFYVPKTEEGTGKWTSWFNHSKSYVGGQWYTETHDFATMPILIRPGSVIMTNPKLKTPEEDALDGIQLLVNGTLPAESVVEVVNPGQTDQVLKTLRLTRTSDNNDIEVDCHGVGVVYLAR